MAKALSEDIRSRVLKASDAGMSARKASSRFGIGVSSAIRWIARAKLGETTPRPQGRRRGSSLDAHEVFIVGMIEARKDITLNEMVERLADDHANARCFAEGIAGIPGIALDLASVQSNIVIFEVDHPTVSPQQLVDVLWETDCPHVPHHPLPPGSEFHVQIETVFPRDRMVRVTPVVDD